MYDTNPELDREVIKAVVEVVTKNRSHVTYGYLADLIAGKRNSEMSAQAFGPSLGRIQKYCKEVGLPYLSVMVVGKETLLPNEGFFDEYREINPEYAALTDQEVIEKEQQACLACKDWQKLLDYADIK